MSTQFRSKVISVDDMKSGDKIVIADQSAIHAHTFVGPDPDHHDKIIVRVAGPRRDLVAVDRNVQWYKVYPVVSCVKCQGELYRVGVWLYHVETSACSCPSASATLPPNTSLEEVPTRDEVQQ